MATKPSPDNQPCFRACPGPQPAPPPTCAADMSSVDREHSWAAAASAEPSSLGVSSSAHTWGGGGAVVQDMLLCLLTPPVMSSWHITTAPSPATSAAQQNWGGVGP